MKRIVFIFCLLIIPVGGLFSQTDNKTDSYLLDPVELVSELYNLVSAEPGIMPDWDKIRGAFYSDALIILRTGWDSTTIFDVERFIQDFVNFYARPGVMEAGFREKIIALKPVVFGEMANIFVLYEAHITGSGRHPQQGVDNFSLVRKNGRWWIISITNEIITQERPAPDFLQLL